MTEFVRDYSDTCILGLDDVVENLDPGARYPVPAGRRVDHGCTGPLGV